MFQWRRKRGAKSQAGFKPDLTEGALPRSMSIESMRSTMSDGCFIQDHGESKDYRIANIFWRAKLSCHSFYVGDPLVTFGDLWPSDGHLQDLISCFKGPELQNAVVTCCQLVLRCGPTRVLQELLDQTIVNIDQRLEAGMGLLHYACLACNGEAVSFLCSRGASIKQQDKFGRTPEQLCFCSKTRRCLPTRYQGNSFRKKQPSSFHDKKVIFELVKQPDKFNDLQIQIQTMDFDINHDRDRDQDGNLLLHAAVKEGLSQLALVLNLVQVHGANVESTNRKGMTPLCLAAQRGLDSMVEILICTIGADPNTQNHVNGWTPLHYAAHKNHLNVIDCLLRRGADLNIEDNFSMRADDIAERRGYTECKDLIQSRRYQKCQMLSQLVRNENLVPNDNRVRLSDQFNVDNEGYTLIMAAAKANRCDNLRILLKNDKSPVNAQHLTTGRTALCMAAIDGSFNVIQTLLHHSALPHIPDIYGRLPLHYACLHGHVDCVRAILETQLGLTGLYEAYEQSKNNPVIRDLVQDACERRQREIVNPTLFECAMNGNASKIYCILEMGDDVNPSTGISDWPMYIAVGNGHFEVIKLLQQYGGDVWKVHATTGSTVLHVACSRGLKEIVKFLLPFCNPNEYYNIIDINAVNRAGRTALQLAASKGYSSIVKMLLDHGASAAIVDDSGYLYTCREFEGVQALIERHRKSRTELIMLGIKDKKRLKSLKKMWQPKFDHNLRNKAGDTPLMAACLYGRLEVVKFLLETAIQNTEEEAAEDFERSMRRRDSDSDSGTFLESCSPGTSRRRNSGAFLESYSSMSSRKYFPADPSEMSDLEEEGWDVSALHPALHGLYPTSTLRHSQDYSSDSDSNMVYEGMKRKGFGLPSGQTSSLSSRRSLRGSRQFVSDTETLENHSNSTLQARGGCQGPGMRYAPSLASIRSASMMSLTDTECTGQSSQRDQLFKSLRTNGGNRDNQDQGWRRSPSVSTLYLSHGQPSRPNIIQGSTINHLFASSPFDGSTALHRCVQCSDAKTSPTILGLLLAKDPSLINIQDLEGQTPLHLACKLDRRQLVKKLLATDGIDLNIRTLVGNLPDQMARSEKSRVAKMVRNARQNMSEDRAQGVDQPITAPSSVGGSSIDFDRLDERFEQMRR
ncbi:uncharacterized protein [Diadema setosum]|uniref:uncharacterized protein n=1 Tax=Diadema setosum TaxID=31175 RepID=UPI003B3AF448